MVGPFHSEWKYLVQIGDTTSTMQSVDEPANSEGRHDVALDPEYDSVWGSADDDDDDEFDC